MSSYLDHPNLAAENARQQRLIDALHTELAETRQKVEHAERVALGERNELVAAHNHVLGLIAAEVPEHLGWWQTRAAVNKIRLILEEA